MRATGAAMPIYVGERLQQLLRPIYSLKLFVLLLLRLHINGGQRQNLLLVQRIM